MTYDEREDGKPPSFFFPLSQILSFLILIVFPVKGLTYIHYGGRIIYISYII